LHFRVLLFSSHNLPLILTRRNSENSNRYAPGAHRSRMPSTRRQILTLGVSVVTVDDRQRLHRNLGVDCVIVSRLLTDDQREMARVPENTRINNCVR